MSNKTLKILGFTATAIAVVAQAVQGWTDEKKLENRVNELADKRFEELIREIENDTSGEES